MDQGTVAIVTSGVVALAMFAFVVQTPRPLPPEPTDGPVDVDPGASPLWHTAALPPDLLDKPRFYRAAQGVAADCLPKSSVVLDCAEPPCALVIRSRNDHAAGAVKRCPAWVEAFGERAGVRRTRCGPGWLTVVFPAPRGLNLDDEVADVATVLGLVQREGARFEAIAAAEGCEPLGPEAPVRPTD